jgi:aspartyl-tRNA(Asn)/glutamyl-tRNA(Gln) amidotransferase subunit A
LPAFPIPCGFTTAGLPFGIEIAGPAFADSSVLTLSYEFEARTEWHAKHPAVFLPQSLLDVD